MRVSQVQIMNLKTGEALLFPADEVFEHLPRTGEAICIMDENGEIMYGLDGVIKEVRWSIIGSEASVFIDVQGI